MSGWVAVGLVVAGWVGLGVALVWFGRWWQVRERLDRDVLANLRRNVGSVGGSKSWNDRSRW